MQSSNSIVTVLGEDEDIGATEELSEGKDEGPANLPAAAATLLNLAEMGV